MHREIGLGIGQGNVEGVARSPLNGWHTSGVQARRGRRHRARALNAPSRAVPARRGVRQRPRQHVSPRGRRDGARKACRVPAQRCARGAPCGVPRDGGEALGSRRRPRSCLCLPGVGLFVIASVSNFPHRHESRTSIIAYRRHLNSHLSRQRVVVSLYFLIRERKTLVRYPTLPHDES